MINQWKQLETVKSVKRHARFTYLSNRATYETRLQKVPEESRKVYLDAISVLDGMHAIYERLKMLLNSGMISVSKRELNKQVHDLE